MIALATLRIQFLYLSNLESWSLPAYAHVKYNLENKILPLDP